MGCLDGNGSSSWFSLLVRETTSWDVIETRDFVVASASPLIPSSCFLLSYRLVQLPLDF